MVQCICQICVCGRHHCGHKKEARVPFAKDKVDSQHISEHRERYRHFGYQPPAQPIKPSGETEWVGTEPTVKESTARHDYTPKPLEKRQPARPQDDNLKPSGKIEHDTTYKKAFYPKEFSKRTACKSQSDEIKFSGNMAVDTTYMKDFTPKEGAMREPMKGKGGTLTELGKPFNGNTETRLRYTPHPFSKRDPCLPSAVDQLKFDGEFAGDTTHKTDFTPKKQKPREPYRLKDGRKHTGEGEFYGETTHAYDYKCPKLGERPEIRIPEPQIVFSKDPFEGVSGYKKDYIAHKISAREQPKWHPSFRRRDTSSKEPFYSETTHKTDYPPPPENFDMVEKKFQVDNITKASGPMETETTNMRDFKPIENMRRVRSFKPDVEYKKPEGRFDGRTTTASDFTVKKMEYVRQFGKQMDNIIKAEGPMDEISTTMHDYQGRCMDCPAKYLKLYGKDALPNTFQYKERTGGHTYFKKLKTNRITVKA